MPVHPLPIHITAVRRALVGRPAPVPLVSWHVCAGFPSPAEDHVEGVVDLNDLVVRNPPATFFMRVAGHSMIEAGIHDGDLIVVDRSVEPVSGAVVIACLNGEMTVKRIQFLRDAHGRGCFLVPENDRFASIRVTEDDEFEVWGVVTHVVHALQPRQVRP